MKQHERRVEKPNPNAPAELSRFAFLIGRWKFDAKFKLPDGDWQSFYGTWLGHYILDGYRNAYRVGNWGSCKYLILLASPTGFEPVLPP